MACPYAKNIRGTVAYCSLLGKKVSTLRFPCKGNYKRCPIYIRYSGRQRAPERRAKPQTPPPETVQTPQPRKETPAQAPQIEASTARTVAEERPASTGNIKPSEVLCDSLILAALLASGTLVDRYNGDFAGLLSTLNAKHAGGELIFIVGHLGSYSLRALYRSGKLVYAFESNGVTICGADAEKLLEDNINMPLDAILYKVEWENIPLWRDTIVKELS